VVIYSFLEKRIYVYFYEKAKYSPRRKRIKTYYIFIVFINLFVTFVVKRLFKQGLSTFHVFLENIRKSSSILPGMIPRDYTPE